MLSDNTTCSSDLALNGLSSDPFTDCSVSETCLTGEWPAAGEVHYSQSTLLPHGWQDIWQLEMVKRSKKKRLTEKVHKGQLLLYRQVVRAPLSTPRSPFPGAGSGSPLPSISWKPTLGLRAHPAWLQLGGFAESLGGIWAWLWVFSLGKRGDQSGGCLEAGPT